MIPVFSHEKLAVYQRALVFHGIIEALVADWDSKHAIVDHLPRAAESVVENIAAASASFSADKQNTLGYALGSTLECAACLDIACIKRLIDEGDAAGHKDKLLEIFSMLFGLRKAWARSSVREDPARYETGGTSRQTAKRFHHEDLDAYVVALGLMRWFCDNEPALPLSAKLFRKLDGLATCIVLNIAEGNGRFSKGDQRRFFGTAHGASIKMAAQFDLCAQKNLLGVADVQAGKELLVRIAGMTAAMCGVKGE